MSGVVPKMSSNGSSSESSNGEDEDQDIIPLMPAFGISICLTVIVIVAYVKHKLREDAEERMKEEMEVCQEVDYEDLMEIADRTRVGMVDPRAWGIIGSGSRNLFIRREK